MTVVPEVLVIPRARNSALAGRRDGAWLVRLQVPPVRRAANAAPLDVLGRAPGIPPPVRITGLDHGEVEVRLAAGRNDVSRDPRL